MKFFTLMIIGILLAGCQQNPYDGRPATQSPDAKPPAPPAEKVVPLDSYSLQVPDTMTFIEGQYGEYKIAARVPTPGKVVLSFDQLPAGMVYDVSLTALTWTPGFLAADEPQNPGLKKRYIPITVTVMSSENSRIAVSKKALVVIQDMPKEFKVVSSNTGAGVENTPFVHKIQIENLEYPTGPFEIWPLDIPAGAKLNLSQSSVPEIVLEVNPDLTTVVGAKEKTFSGKVLVLDPKMRKLEVPFSWTIQNQIVSPLIVGPRSIEQVGTASFTLLAEDPNAEEPPKWKIVNKPNEGEFLITQSTSVGTPQNPKTLAVVEWRKIPKTSLGKRHVVILSACVQSVCRNFEVEMTVTASGGS